MRFLRYVRYVDCREYVREKRDKANRKEDLQKGCLSRATHGNHVFAQQRFQVTLRHDISQLLYSDTPMSVFIPLHAPTHNNPRLTSQVGTVTVFGEKNSKNINTVINYCTRVTFIVIPALVLRNVLYLYCRCIAILLLQIVRTVQVQDKYRYSCTVDLWMLMFYRRCTVQTISKIQ